MPDEPQSYGSEGDWVSGHVGEKVNELKSPAGENRREKESSGPHQGGEVSDEQKSDENAAPEACDAFDSGDEGAKKVADLPGGSRRDSFFKERDYRG